VWWVIVGVVITLDTFPDSQSPPFLADAPRLLARLAEMILREQPAYDDLFSAELALRALLPVLEEALRERIEAGGAFDGMGKVDAALTQLARALTWIELNGQASLAVVHAWLRECVMAAQEAVGILV
jgi:hypothetical protein